MFPFDITNSYRGIINVRTALGENSDREQTTALGSRILSVAEAKLREKLLRHTNGKQGYRISELRFKH